MLHCNCCASFNLSELGISLSSVPAEDSGRSGAQIQASPLASLAIDLGPLQLRNKREILGSIFN